MLPERATPEAPQGWWQAHLHLLDLLWGHFPTAGGARAGRTQAAGGFRYRGERYFFACFYLKLANR